MISTRRQWLGISAAATAFPAFVSNSQELTHGMRQVYADIQKVLWQDDALPPVDWYDMQEMLEGWGPSPWYFTVTGDNLPTMLADCRGALVRQLNLLDAAPAGVFLTVLGDGHVFRLKHHTAFVRGIRRVLDSDTFFMSSAARDSTLKDALRVTVITNAKA